MKIIIKAKPNAKTETIEELKRIQGIADPKRSSMPIYKISVKATASDGKANDAIIRALAKHFGVRTSDVRIVSGNTSKKKIVEVTV